MPDPAAVTGEEPTPELVQQIKDLQRGNPEAKDQWIAYTDTHGAGRRDPSKHPAPFLQHFLTHYASGARLALHEDAGHVCELVKVMQKKSENFKNVWEGYCKQFGNGETDPALLEPAFMVKFLDQIAEKANLVTPSCTPGITGNLGTPGGLDGPALKRQKIETAGGISSGDPMKDKLVTQIKAFQRQGDDNRELWRRFCETNLASVLDPNRHEVSVLQHFVTACGVPEAEASIGPMMMGGPMVGSDPEKDALVQLIKTFQRQGQEQKDAWTGFCGHTRDPARHETVKLLEFCSMYGVS